MTSWTKIFAQQPIHIQAQVEPLRIRSQIFNNLTLTAVRHYFDVTSMSLLDPTEADSMDRSSEEGEFAALSAKSSMDLFLT